MILTDYITEIADNCNIDAADSTNKAKIIRAINYIVREILNEPGADYWWAKKPYTLTTTNGQSEYYLPAKVGNLISIRQTTSPRKLDEIKQENFNRIIPNPILKACPIAWMRLGLYGVMAQMGSASAVNAVSDSASDSTQTVVIRGLAGDQIDSEQLVLSGLCPVTTTKQFTEVFTASKQTTTGTVTVKYSSTAMATLLPAENEKEYIKIKFYGEPDGVYSLYCMYKIKEWKVSNDYDAIIVPNRYANTIIDGGTGLMFVRQGDDTKGSTWIGKFTQGKKRMKIEAEGSHDNENLNLPEIITLGI